MDDLWHLKGLNRQSNLMPASLNQIEMLSGPLGHPFVQQEVCVIERTIRQESLGASLLNFGLPGSYHKSVRGDVGNPLLAFVPGSQHQVRSSHQSIVASQSPHFSPNPQAYQMGSVGSPCGGSWPGHLSNMSAGNCVSGGSSGLGVDSSINMPGREVTLSMSGRELNLTQYSRMASQQDYLEPSMTRTSGVEMSKNNVVQYNANDVSGQGPYPQWMTEIISSRQRGQTTESHDFAGSPRAAEPSLDGSAPMSSLFPLAPALMREARVVCINHETGQRIGGELYLTQLGLLGVICSCHGSHMSVAKFTQHVGIYSTNPGNVVAMDGTGESLVQWRKILFSLYGIKVPCDNQGWNWTDGAVSESGPTKYKAVVTQSWQKEVDVSYHGLPSVKSRLTQICDASVLPSNAATLSYPLTQSSAGLGLIPNSGGGCIQSSKDAFLKRFERAFRGSHFDFESCPSSAEHIGESTRRCQSLSDMRSCRNSSTECINFISDSHQLMANHIEQQVVVEQQTGLGSRSLLKGLDLTWSERREPPHYDKDNSSSSFELKLGQPSQQAQSVGPPVSSAAVQMRRVMQRGLDIGGQQNMQNSSATGAAGLQTFSACEGPSISRLFNHSSFGSGTEVDPYPHRSWRVEPTRGIEASGLGHGDHSTLKGTDDVSTVRYEQNVREGENVFNRDAGLFSPGMRRWPTVGSVGSSLKLPEGPGMNTEQVPKRWTEEAQLRVGGAARPITQGHQELTTLLGQEWMSKSQPTEDRAADCSGTMAERDGQACRGENMIHVRRSCSSPCKEVGREEKEQFAYGDMITTRGTREGQGCVYINNGKSADAMLKERLLSKVGDGTDICVMEANHEGNGAEPERHRANRAAGQEPIHDCSSPRDCRHSSLEATVTRACTCGAQSINENSNQGVKAVSLAGNADGPISVAETNAGIDKRFQNQVEFAKSSSKEYNNDAFQWKDTGGIFVSGNDPVSVRTQNDMSSPRALAEDLLADTTANSAVPVSSKISDKQQSVSDICSKSFENGMGRFPDAAGEAQEVSNAHSVEKNSVGSGVVDEASGIGMCSSSDGADMGIMPNLNISSTDNRNQQHASPCSGGSPSLCNANEGSRTKAKTRSRGDSAVIGPEARNIAEDVSGDTGKAEKKRKRTMKWRWLDAAIGATDDKRHKSSPPANVAETSDVSQNLRRRSDTSSLEKKNVVGFSSHVSGEDSATKAHTMKVTQGDQAALNPEHGIDDTGVNGKDSLHSDKTCLTRTETLVIRVPQGLNRKKAKRSGRSTGVKMKSAECPEDHTRLNKSPFSDTVTVDPAPIDVSILQDSGGAGGYIPEMTVSATKVVSNQFSKLHTQVGKPGRVILRRPSPRSTTRMVSLKDIMSKPEVVAFSAPKDHVKPSVVEKASDSLARHGSSKGLSSKERQNASAFNHNSVKERSLKDSLEGSYRKDRPRTAVRTEGLKDVSPTDGVKAPRPKEASKTTATEGLKVKLSTSRNGLKVKSPNAGLKAISEKNEAGVSFFREVSKISPLKDGLKTLPSKVGSKGLVCDESLKASCSTRGLKVSTPIASTGKDYPKESAPKNLVRRPATMNSCEVAPPRACSKNASTKNSQKFSLPKIDTESPTSKSGLNVFLPKDCLKSKGAYHSLNMPSRKDTREASGVKTRLKPATLKDRLKTLASRDALQNTFSFEIDIAPVARDISNATVLKDRFKSVVPMDSLEGQSKPTPEVTGSRKADSSIAVATIPRDRGRGSPQVVRTGTESKTTKSQKQEVQKVRSLYELISKKTLPKPGTGVFEFHDEDMEISEHNSAGRPSIKLNSTLSIPVHFANSKCLVPRGERSPRIKPAKTKNSFLLRHKAGGIGAGTPGAEPVEVVVGRKSIEDTKLNVGTPCVIQKDLSIDTRLCPVPPRLLSLQKGKTKCEVNNYTTPNDSVASSHVGARNLVGEDVMAYNGSQSRKRVAEPEIMENAQKRLKFVESSRTSQLRSGLVKKRHSLPISAPTPLLTPFTDVIDSKVKAHQMRSHSVDDLTISEKKKRSQRPKLVNCQAPEGVVECCVCGSSISEFFNQIVCCSLCPVKVHQACYGVKRIPNSAWLCRTCKAIASNPICVLCGYGSGAMTRAQKAMGFVKGLVKVWQGNPKEKADSPPHSREFPENGTRMDHSLANHQHILEGSELITCSGRGKAATGLSEFDPSSVGCVQRNEKPVPKEGLMPCNTVSSGLLDLAVVQWVHMVCALWMPGTRCLNFGTMGVFDVSGVAQSRRKLICSICNRKGGACIQCRVVKCGVPFHAWCAHEKGLLQSEIVEDGSDQVGFYGKCLRHGQGGDFLRDNPNVSDIVRDEPGHPNQSTSSCARTEGYAGKLTLEQRAIRRRQASRNGSTSVAPEQVAAWLRINERKTCKARRFLKSANSDQKTDHREYLRFKQEQGWRRLSVYKSGIHALGLYTAEFIARGEMVVEYVGEIVGLRVADKREADYHSGKRMQYQGACYLFRIDRERIIDATRKGGIARFVNHSCSPNCVAKVICVKNESKVVFFAQRDIYAGEEVTYDYQFNFEQEGDKIPCFCGSANCRGTLN